MSRASTGHDARLHMPPADVWPLRVPLQCWLAHLPLRRLVLAPTSRLATAVAWLSGVARRNPIPSHPSVGPTRPRPDERALRASAEIPASQPRGLDPQLGLATAVTWPVTAVACCCP